MEELGQHLKYEADRQQNAAPFPVRLHIGHKPRQVEEGYGKWITQSPPRGLALSVPPQPALDDVIHTRGGDP